MTSVSTSRRQGLNSSAAIKVPVRVGTTANITLSALQTIDGVVLASGDRVLVKDQTTTSENGIYVADTGTWTRDLDFDGSYDVVEGTLVTIVSGATLSSTLWRVYTTSPSPGSAMTFVQSSLSSADATSISYTAPGVGAVAQTAAGVLNQIVYASTFGFLTTATAAVNTTALATIATKMNAIAGGILVIAPGTYQFNGAIDHSVLCQFTSLKGIAILAPGVVLDDQTTYAGTEYGYVFGFNACTNISIPPGLKITSDNNIPNLRGLKAFQFGQGCNGIDLWWDQDGGLSGVEFYRAYTDAVGYRTKNYRLHGKVSNVFYPVNGQHSGDLGEVWIDTVNCGRNFFYYGARGVTIHNDQKNQQSTAKLSAYNGYGCEDFKIFIRNRESTDCSAAATVMEIDYIDTTAAAHRNIDVNFDVLNPAADPFSATLGFAKYDGAGAADSTGRGHILDGLRVSGISEQTTGRNHFNTIAGAFVTTGTPDVLRNVKIENFTGIGATLNDNFAAIAGALADRMVWENVNYDSIIYVANGANGRVVFNGCKADDFSAATTDTDLHDLNNCNITDGTKQALSGKRFINSPFSRTGVNVPATGEWITPTYAAGSFTADGGATWDVAAGDVTAYQYTLVGKMMTVNFTLDSTSIAAAAPNTLILSIPSGFTAAKTTGNALSYIVDNGAAVATGRALVTATGATIGITKTAPAAAWTIGANNVSVHGSITFEVA